MSLLVLTACNASKKGNNNLSENDFEPNSVPGPRAIVYQTKADYKNLVPVILNEEKTQIISYPHPTDLVINGKLKTPIQLKNDWFLDEKGINENVAFLSLTYYEYSKQETAPSIDSLFNLIIDKDPIIKMCDCGNRLQIENIEETLNSLIENNLLEKQCKKLK